MTQENFTSPIEIHAGIKKCISHVGNSNKEIPIL
jgi:hypothetical protein